MRAPSLGLGVVASAIGATGWSPADLSPYAWYKGTVGVTDAGGGAVSQWNDSSGNARHLVQATAGSRPSTGTHSLNGHNVINFAGNKFLALTSLSIAQAFYVLAVVKFTSLADYEAYFDGHDDSTNYIVVLTSPGLSDHLLMVSDATPPDSADLGVAPTVNVAEQHVAVFNGASSVFYRNGTQIGGALSALGNVTANRIRLGGTYDGALSDVDIAELVVVQGSTPSAGTRTSWAAYVLQEWGF
jgi:hypothetical protein